MKVWIVTYNWGSEYGSGISKVFSSEEKAKHFMEKEKTPAAEYGFADDIIEFEVE